MSDFYSDLFSVHGKKVVITGATGYFGRHTARTFLEAGATVILVGRSAELEEQTQKFRNEYGESRVFSYRVDFYKRSELAAVCREIRGEHTPDVLVNNAFDFTTRSGFNTDDGRLETSTFEQCQTAFESGVYWAVLTTQVIGEGMRVKGGGSIINISSMYAMVSPSPDLYTGTNFFNPPSYGVMKAGLMAFTRYVAAFWGASGVRCNALLPGAMPNVEAKSANSVGKGDAFLERLSNRTLLKRVGHPKDLRGALILLASEAGGYITGQGIIIDGGWTVT